MARGQSSSDQALPAHWVNETQRVDGFVIHYNPDNDLNLCIETPYGTRIKECPCCGRPMGIRMHAAARALCDALYPFSAAQQAAGA